MNFNDIAKDFQFCNNSIDSDFPYRSGACWGETLIGEYEGKKETISSLSYIGNKYVLGQSIVDIENKNDECVIFTLSNGLELVFGSNEGCGGCGNGWWLCSDLIDTREKGNIITNVEIHEPKCEDDVDTTFSVFIYSNDKRIVQTDFTGSDNGYYGVGIWAELVIPEDVLIKLCNGEEI